MVFQVGFDPPGWSIGPIHEHEDGPPPSQSETRIEAARVDCPFTVSAVFRDVDQWHVVPPGEVHDPVVTSLITMIDEDHLPFVPGVGLISHPSQKNIDTAGPEATGHNASVDHNGFHTNCE